MSRQHAHEHTVESFSGLFRGAYNVEARWGLSCEERNGVFAYRLTPARRSAQVVLAVPLRERHDCCTTARFFFSRGRVCKWSRLCPFTFTSSSTTIVCNQQRFGVLSDVHSKGNAPPSGRFHCSCVKLLIVHRCFRCSGCWGLFVLLSRSWLSLVLRHSWNPLTSLDIPDFLRSKT